MKKSYYKVVFLNNKDWELESVITRQGWVTYELGKVTKPRKKCGPLCVFDNKRRAILFAEEIVRRLLIFRVEIKKSFKKYVKNEREKTKLSDLPRGTVLAKSVKLVECVWHYESGELS